MIRNENISHSICFNIHNASDPFDIKIFSHLAFWRTYDLFGAGFAIETPEANTKYSAAVVSCRCPSPLGRYAEPGDF